MQSMTLDELAAVDREYYTPSEVAPFLGVQPYSLNVAARNGELKGIEFVLCGRNLKFPKRAFLRVMGYQKEKEY